MIVAMVALAWHGLQGDGRLDKAIGIAEYAVPAPALCRDLAKLVGVPITCDPALRDDQIVLVVKQRPAKEIMAKVASTFDWQWLPFEGGYRLAPTDDFTRRANTGRAEILAADGQRIKEAVKEYVAKLRTQDRLAVEKEMNQAFNVLNSAANGGGDDMQARWTKASELKQSIDPATEIAMATILDLTRDQIVQLADHRLVVSSDPGPLEIGLDRTATKAVSDCAAMLQKQQKEAEDKAGKGDDAPQVMMLSTLFGSASEIASAIVQLDSWTQANVSLVTTDGRVLMKSQVAIPKPKYSANDPLPKDLADALLRTSIGNEDYPPAITPDGAPDTLFFFGTWIELVAKHLDADVISDAYDPYMVFAGESQKQTVAHLTAFRNDGFNPVLQGGWLANRNSKWPRYREEQAPRDVMRSFEGSSDLMSLDDRASIASRLTVPQLQSPVLPITRPDYWFYCFWNGLPQPLRDTLRTGKKLRFGDLPETLVSYLYEVGESPSEENPFSFSWGGGGLFTEPDFVDYDKILARIRPDAGLDENDPQPLSFVMALNDFAVLYPGRVDSSASVWIQGVNVPGVYDPESRQMYYPGDLAQPEFTLFEPATKLKLVKSHGYRFHFQLRKGVEVCQDISEAVLGDDIAGDRSKWPADLLDRIKKRQELQKTLESSTQPTPPPNRHRPAWIG